MENNILTKEYVLDNGVNLEELWNEYCSDRILDKPEDEGGKPFTGLVYELYSNNEIDYYCFYKDGFEHGDYVEFYENRNIKSIQYMEYGTIVGKEETWFESGSLKSVAEYKYGVCLRLKEWNEEGNLIKEKLEPTENDLNIINRQKEWYKVIGRE